MQDIICDAGYLPICFKFNLQTGNAYVVAIQELMTRHKSTVAEYLSKNYEWVIDLFLLGLEAFFLIFLIMGKVWKHQVARSKLYPEMIGVLI